jgi:hypothetical protein
MGKRSSFEPRPRGFHTTPPEAIPPLLPLLPIHGQYGEPCAGNNRLIEGLAQHWPKGKCIWASDIHPMADGIERMDALDIPLDAPVPMWITNPPWPNIGKKGDPALSIVAHLIKIAPTWALLPYAFGANSYYARLARYCQIVLPIGRLSWEGNGIKGKDDCAWFLFSAQNRTNTVLLPRQDEAA